MGVVTDPIADMLTRIRNGVGGNLATVEVPSSQIKLEIAKILVQEGYISSFEETGAGQFKSLKVTLKSSKINQPMSGIQRVSRPGLRRYASSKNLPRVLGGLGVAIVSTSRGIMTDKQARKLGVGGEILCYVW